MEEQAKEVASTIIPQIEQLSEKVLVYLESGVDLAAEQAPQLITEILSWSVFDGLFWAGFAMVLLVIVGVVVKKLWGIAEGRKYDSDEMKFLAFAVGLVGSAVGGIIFCSNFFYAIKAIVAPRLLLIEYFSNLVNGG